MDTLPGVQPAGPVRQQPVELRVNSALMLPEFCAVRETVPLVDPGPRPLAACRAGLRLHTCAWVWQLLGPAVHAGRPVLIGSLCVLGQPGLFVSVKVMTGGAGTPCRAQAAGCTQAAPMVVPPMHQHVGLHVRCRVDAPAGSLAAS